MKFTEIGGYISTWYRVCTKTIFTSKGSYGNVEHKNAIIVSVQKAYFPIWACKLPGLTRRRRKPTMKFAEIQSYLSTWYRVCTKAIFTSKESYGNVQPKNAILVSLQKVSFPIRACKLPGFKHRRQGQQWNLMKFYATFPHGNVFALRQYLHHNKVTGMYNLKVQSFTHRCVEPTTNFAEIGGYLSTW